MPMTPEQTKRFALIESCLLAVFDEIKDQEDVGKLIPPNHMSFSKEKELIFEFIDLAGEFGLAYELMGSMTNQTSSQGCIVLPPAVRNIIGNSGDTTLRVVE